MCVSAVGRRLLRAVICGAVAAPRAAEALGEGVRVRGPASRVAARSLCVERSSRWVAEEAEVVARWLFASVPGASCGQDVGEERVPR